MSALFATDEPGYVKNETRPASRRHSHNAARVDFLVDTGKAPRPRSVPTALRRATGKWSPSATTEAYDYARVGLRRAQAQVEAAGYSNATAVAANAMLFTLRDVLSDDSVYPTISIDEEGGVTAEWHAGALTLEVDVDPHGAMEWSLRGKTGQVAHTGKSTTPLRRILRDLSAFVADANPNWRALFPKGHSHHNW